MSDEELRRLEREVERADTPTARLALAQALERAGRELAAWETALPAARDPAVAEWLRRYPVWCAPGGDAGATCYVDLPPPKAALSRGGRA